MVYMQTAAISFDVLDNLVATVKELRHGDAWVRRAPLSMRQLKRLERHSAHEYIGVIGTRSVFKRRPSVAARPLMHPALTPEPRDTS
jgi:hypothetical protein